MSEMNDLFYIHTKKIHVHPVVNNIFLYLTEMCEITCFIGTCFPYNKIHMHLEKRDKAWLNTEVFIFVNSYSLSRNAACPCLLSCLCGLEKLLECKSSVNVNFVPLLSSV